MEKRRFRVARKLNSAKKRILISSLGLNLTIVGIYIFTVYLVISNISASDLRHDLLIDRVGVVSLSFGIIFGLANYFLIQRVTEPMDKLMNYFKEVGDQQEVLPLTFRENDYYKELPALIIESYKRVSEKDEDDTYPKSA